MKITMIGPGFVGIPPTGHGAVEFIIWQYATNLQRLGHEVQVVNAPRWENIPEVVNGFKPDFVHIHHDYMAYLADDIKCLSVALTNHDGYAEWPHLRPPHYTAKIQEDTMKFRGYHLCPSDRLRRFYIGHFGVREDKAFTIPDGASSDEIRFTPAPLKPKNTICLGMIHRNQRKNQVFLSECNAEIEFVGPYEHDFKVDLPNYLGDWTRNDVNEKLTEYANLVLLSKGEAAPLVVMEALMAGLGVVISENASANLDVSKPWISVVPERYMYNWSHVKNVVEKNREVSLSRRREIRSYAMENFDWKKLSQRYANMIQEKLL